MPARDPEQTRQRILEAAGRLFYRDGIRPVAMDTIAESAGVTKRTLYYHFESKDALVVAYLRNIGERLDASLARAMSRKGGGPMERLLGLFEDLEARFARDEFRGCPFMNAAAELTDLEPARAEAVAYKERRRAWFEAVVRELGVGDPVALSEQLMILTDGAIALWLVQRDRRAAIRARHAALVLVHSAMASGRPGEAIPPGAVPSTDARGREERQ
jgi:AcrR family transcriptional regulator